MSDDSSAWYVFFCEKQEQGYSRHLNSSPKNNETSWEVPGQISVDDSHSSDDGSYSTTTAAAAVTVDDLLDEIRGLLAAGVPAGARPFGGLVYRQAMEHLRGVRDEAETRALIAQENRKYARRQLIWFRKEPNLVWFDGPGTHAEVQDSVVRMLAARDLSKDGKNVADT